MCVFVLVVAIVDTEQSRCCADWPKMWSRQHLETATDSAVLHMTATAVCPVYLCSQLCGVATKGKDFPYSLLSVRPGADLGVQAASPQVTISHPPGGRLPLLSARPAVTFPAAEHHRPLAGTKLYCLVTEACRCEQLAQGCYAAYAPSRIWTHDLLITSPMLYPLSPMRVGGWSWHIIDVAVTITTNCDRLCLRWIVQLHFQAGCRRRRLHLASVFCVLILCYVYFLLSSVFVIGIWFYFVSCGMLVVSPCCSHWRNNLNEPLDLFPILGGCWTKRRPWLRLICRWPSFTG